MTVNELMTRHPAARDGESVCMRENEEPSNQRWMENGSRFEGMRLSVLRCGARTQSARFAVYTRFADYGMDR